jgi:hypothetical protein
MAKENPNTKPKATPFRKFEQLAKKLVRVPKKHVEQAKASRLSSEVPDRGRRS